MSAPYFDNGTSSIYNGDCFDLIPSLANEGRRVDKVLTSPPYNIRNNRPDRRYDVYDDIIGNDEYIGRMLGLFGSLDSILNPNGCILWNMSYGGENTELLPLLIGSIVRDSAFTMADVLVWKKRNNGIPNNVSPNKMTRGCEFVFVFCRRGEFKTFTANKKVISHRKNGNPCYENYYNWFEAPNGECIDLNHSTFSVEFVNELLDRYVRADDVVLDPFAGTGTTAVACDARGIRNVCVELSEAQCAYAVERLTVGADPKSYKSDYRRLGLFGNGGK